MTLQIRLRCFGIAVIGLLSPLGIQAQMATPSSPVTQPDTKVIAARISEGPLDSSATLGPTLPEPAVLSSAAALPLAPQPVLRPTGIHREAGPTTREMRVWKGLLVAEHSAAIFDAWTTRESLKSGNGYERNPLLKPFADSAAIYPMLQIAPVGFDFLSHRMMRSQNRFLRKTWWVPQLVSTGASLWCGSRNLRVANLNR